MPKGRVVSSTGVSEPVPCKRRKVDHFDRLVTEKLSVGTRVARVFVCARTFPPWGLDGWAEAFLQADEEHTRTRTFLRSACPVAIVERLCQRWGQEGLWTDPPWANFDILDPYVLTSSEWTYLRRYSEFARAWFAATGPAHEWLLESLMRDRPVHPVGLGGDQRWDDA